MQQRTTFPSGGLVLEGVLHRPVIPAPFPAVAVCHPHPLYGGDMHNAVVVALCEQLADSGLMALRFNFRGTGRSEGAYGGGTEERNDAAAALDYLDTLSEVDGGRLGLAGYSFGALVALSTGDPRTRGIAVISPPLAMSGPFEATIQAPVLLVFGERDEVAPVDGLAHVEGVLTGGYRVVVIPGADHFWWGLETEAAREVAAFFKQTWES